MSIHGHAAVEYTPFPADLAGRYQHFTEADLSGLREIGYDLPFTSIEDGTRETFSAFEADIL